VVFHQIKVIDAGAKGVSVAKAPDGKVVFIPNVVPVMWLMQTLRSARPIMKSNFMNSEHRIEPICEHFGVCGG
jgi:23S rRNA (uracil1939-C5)-methyltransferase